MIKRLKALWELGGILVFEDEQRHKNIQVQTQHLISMKDDGGGELIMPNLVREKFDEGKVKSVGDIL